MNRRTILSTVIGALMLVPLFQLNTISANAEDREKSAISANLNEVYELKSGIYTTPSPASYFKYTVSNNTVKITGYKVDSNVYVIPDTIEGYPVTEIGTSAFSGLKSLEYIALPASVQKIGSSAFKSCSNMYEINIPEGVTTLEYDVFYGCSSLTEIQLPSTIESLGGYSLSNTGIVSLSVPEGVTVIGTGAFYGCGSLRTLYLPESLKTLNNPSLNGCQNLSDIYYAGSEKQWNKLNPYIGSQTTVHFAKESLTTFEFVEGSTHTIDLQTGITKYSLNLRMLPASAAAEATVEWNSSNPEIVEVNNSGQLTAKQIGQSFITATADGETISCHVSVIRSDSEHESEGYQAWPTDGTFPSQAGKYYLAGDYGVAETKSVWTVPAGETVLCLNGYTLLSKNQKTFRIVVPQGSVLTVEDCSLEQTGYLEFQELEIVSSSYGATTVKPGITVESGGELNIISGNIGSERTVSSTNATLIELQGGNVNISGGNIVFATYANVRNNPMHVVGGTGNATMSGGTVKIKMTELDADFMQKGYGFSVNGNIEISGGDIVFGRIESLSGRESQYKYAVDISSGGHLYLSGDKTISGYINIGNQKDAVTANLNGIPFTGKASVVAIKHDKPESIIDGIEEGINDTAFSVLYYQSYSFYGNPKFYYDGIIYRGSQDYQTVTLSQPELTITGSPVQLTADVKDWQGNPVDETITWKSANTNYATVDENGLVKPQKTGNTTITATTSKNNKAQCTVTITGVDPDSISLNESSIEIYKDESAALTATILPDGTTDKTITWTSSNESVAIVDQAGQVTGVTDGTATITATTHNGKTAECDVLVIRRILEYTIENDEVTITRYNGTDNELVIPAEIDGKPVTQIGENAFYQCSTLTNVVIPESVTFIGTSAFAECTSLTGVTIPDSVTILSPSTFALCRSLTSIILPAGISSIGSYTFHNCNSLKSVVIPENVTSIQNDAFLFCDSLENVEYLSCTSDWDRIDIETGNDSLTSATIHYTGNTVGEWNWADDYSAATVDILCSEHNTVEKTIDAAVIRNTTSATCETEGKTEFTGSIEFDGETYSETKTEQINALGHDLIHTEAVPATCYETGNSEYWRCQRCEKYFSDGEAAAEIEEYSWIIPATGHNWDEWTVTTEPTCTEAGEETRICTRDESHIETRPAEALGHDLIHTEAIPATCEETGNSEYWTCQRCEKYFSDEEGTTEIEEDSWIIPATGHDWGEWTVTTEPTCTELGEETRICTNDESHIGTRPAEALGHDLIHTEAVPATCEEAGNREYWTCQRCEKYFSDGEAATEIEEDSWIIPATGHNWGEWTVTTEPTCTEAGEERRICANDPSHTDTRTVEPLGHDYGNWEIIQNPTCEVDGLKQQICANDPTHINSEAIPALGHKWGNWIIGQEPTCTRTGYQVRVCGNDSSHTETETLEKIPHSWSEWTIVKPATFEEEGILERTCTVCGEEENTTIPVISHTHTFTKTEAVEATCEEEGNIEYYYCEECDRYYKDEEGNEKISEEETIIPALGHQYGEWQTVTEATCEEDGLERRICEHDENHVEELVIPATGHDYGNWEIETEATCEETGLKHRICANDPTHVIEEQIPAIGHNWGEWTVTTEATCTEPGEETRTCANDPSHTETRTTEALGHDLRHVEEVPATCQEEGTREYWECEVCGKKFEDAEGTTEITDIVIPKTEHSYEWMTDQAATCTEAGSRHEECSMCGNRGEDEVIPALGHDLKHVAEVPATCQEEGTREYWECEVCGKKYEDAEGTTEITDIVIPKTEHQYSEAWESNDVYHYHVCEECGDIEKPSMVPHVWTGWVKDYETKTMTRECRICERTDKKDIPNGQWKENSKGWWYEYDDGTYSVSEFDIINDKTYYFDSSGYMVTGWQKINNVWYYFASSGAMQSGWQKINNVWYYFDSEGKMQSGWQLIDNTWYYFSSGGAMQSGWQKINNVWYYFASSGAMRTGWQKISNVWYYFADTGAMQTGWHQVKDKWYYFESSGAMKSSAWEGNYYLKADGSMAVNEWVDNDRYYVDENGKWVPGKTK